MNVTLMKQTSAVKKLYLFDLNKRKWYRIKLRFCNSPARDIFRKVILSLQL